MLLPLLAPFKGNFHDVCRAAFGVTAAARLERTMWFPVRLGGVGVPLWSDTEVFCAFVAGAAAYVCVFRSSVGPLREEAASLVRRLPPVLATDSACLLLACAPRSVAAPAPSSAAHIYMIYQPNNRSEGCPAASDPRGSR